MKDGRGSVPRARSCSSCGGHLLGVDLPRDREVRDLPPRLGDLRRDQVAKASLGRSGLRRLGRALPLETARSRAERMRRAETLAVAAGRARLGPVERGGTRNGRGRRLVGIGRSRRLGHRLLCQYAHDRRADGNHVAGLGEVRAQPAGDRADDVHRRLVRLDLGDRLVDGDGVAGRLVPLDDHRLLHCDADRGNHDLRHESGLASVVGSEAANCIDRAAAGEHAELERVARAPRPARASRGSPPRPAPGSS